MTSTLIPLKFYPSNSQLKNGAHLRRFKRRAKERKGHEKIEELHRKLLKRLLKEGIEDEEVLKYEE